MPAVLPILILGRHQPEVDLVHQLGGLPVAVTTDDQLGVALPLALHHVVGKAPQIGDDQPEQFVLGLAVPVAPLMQELRNVAHFSYTGLLK